MSIDYLNNNLDRKSQNITTLSSEDTFNIQDSTNLQSSYNSSTGYGLIDAEEALEIVTGEEIDEVEDLGGNNWGADLIGAPEVWNAGYTGEDVVVAVLDTGVDYNHEDLQDNIWTNSGEIPDNGIDDDGNGFVDDVYGWNFHDDNNDTLDVNGHGTHVAGIIAGENNDYGVTGIAYDAEIMPVKVLDDDGSGYDSSIVDGIYYAVDNGADVINLSLGGTYPNSELESAIEYAHENDVVVVMSAGNDSGDTPLYPANYADEYGIAVGAVDQNSELADFSNRAGEDELAYVTAPGVDVYSTVPDNQYEYYSGTSMAAPYVSGTVALMLSADPTLTADEITEIITQSADNDTQTTNSDTSNLDSDFAASNLTQTTVYSNDFNDNTVNFDTDTSIGLDSNISSEAGVSSIITDAIFSNPEMTSELLNLYQDYLDVTTSIEEIIEDYNADELPLIPT